MNTERTQKPVASLALVLALGIVARLACSFAGHNFDAESYRIVADILARGSNVYAETARYNYGPPWFLILRGLDLLPGFGLAPLEALHLKVAALLTGVDVAICLLLRRQFGARAAALFFLNPVSILITGFHGQFDNLAVLVALVAVEVMGDAAEGPERRIGRWLAGLALVGLSLSVKHLLFLFPAWLALKEPNWRRKLVAGLLPVAVFALSFVPWLGQGWAGILDHVIGYRSFANAPVWQVLLPQVLFGWLPLTLPFVVALALLGVALRGRGRGESLLAYLVALVVFAPAIANQYLAIPIAAMAVWWNRPFRLYTAVATGFILVQADGLGLARLIDPRLTLYGATTQQAYIACTVLLGFGLATVLLPQAARDRLVCWRREAGAWLEREIAVQLRAPL